MPAALPGIISGLKVTLAISWSCVLTAEMIAAQNGLGAMIWQAKDWGNLPLVLVGMVCISLHRDARRLGGGAAGVVAAAMGAAAAWLTRQRRLSPPAM